MYALFALADRRHLPLQSVLDMPANEFEYWYKFYELQEKFREQS